MNLTLVEALTKIIKKKKTKRGERREGVEKKQTGRGFKLRLALYFYLLSIKLHALHCEKWPSFKDTLLSFYLNSAL